MKPTAPGLELKKLLRRPGKVLAVLGAPNAFHAKIMEASGVEACFVGTSITGGNYTGLPDLGILSMTECVGFAKWIARSVKMPVILDGDTGHGGIMAVRRLVRECIDAGLAGLRLDDQPLEQKRRTMSTTSSCGRLRCLMCFSIVSVLDVSTIVRSGFHASPAGSTVRRAA